MRLYDLRSTTLTNGFVGSASITADQPVAAVIIQQADSSAGDYYDTSPGFTKGSTEALFALVFKNFNHSTYNSLLSVTNLGVISTTLTFTYTSWASVAVTETESVNAQGSVVWDLSVLPGIPDSSYGQLQVTSDNAPIVGSLLTAKSNTLGATAENASLVDSELHSPYPYYLPRIRKMASVPELGGIAATGIQVVNESTATSAVTVDFYDEVGTLLGSQTLPLNSGSSVSLYLPTISFLPSSYKGSAIVTANVPVAVLAYTNGLFTSALMASYTGGPAATNSFLPIVYNLNPYLSSSTFVQNSSDSQPAHVRIDYYRSDGTLALTSEDDLPPLASRKYNPDFAGLDPPFNRGSAIVTSSGVPVVAMEEIYGHNVPPPTPTATPTFPPRSYLPATFKQYAAIW